jgi:hypothetical protein
MGCRDSKPKKQELVINVYASCNRPFNADDANVIEEMQKTWYTKKELLENIGYTYFNNIQLGYAHLDDYFPLQERNNSYLIITSKCNNCSKGDLDFLMKLVSLKYSDAFIITGNIEDRSTVRETGIAKKIIAMKMTYDIRMERFNDPYDM